MKHKPPVIDVEKGTKTAPIALDDSDSEEDKQSASDPHTHTVRIMIFFMTAISQTEEKKETKSNIILHKGKYYSPNLSLLRYIFARSAGIWTELHVISLLTIQLPAFLRRITYFTSYYFISYYFNSYFFSAIARHTHQVHSNLPPKL